MIELILFAYDVSPRQISGIPSAFSQERFNIEATCAQPIVKDQIPHMLLVLLAERFHLRIPAKANAIPKGSRTAFRAEGEHHRSVATLAF